MIYKWMGNELPGAGLFHKFIQWSGGSAAPFTTDSDGSTERSRRIACDTCESPVSSKSVRRVYRLIYLISSSAIDYIR